MLLLYANKLLTQTPVNITLLYSYDYICVLIEPNITTNAKYGSGDGLISILI